MSTRIRVWRGTTGFTRGPGLTFATLIQAEPSFYEGSHYALVMLDTGCTSTWNLEGVHFTPHGNDPGIPPDAQGALRKLNGAPPYVDAS